MWDNLKNWLLHGAIETDEKMAADLAGPGYHINRSNPLVLESKADMQKRGLAALLHVGFGLQHQWVAPVDVIPRSRQVRRHLFIRLDRAVQEPVLQVVPHVGPQIGLVRSGVC